MIWLILVGIAGLLIGWVVATLLGLRPGRRQTKAGNLGLTRRSQAAPGAGKAGRMSRYDADAAKRNLHGPHEGSTEIVDLLGRVVGAQRERDRALREREEIARTARQALEQLEPWIQGVEALAAANGYSQSQVGAAFQDLKDMARPRTDAEARQAT